MAIHLVEATTDCVIMRLSLVENTDEQAVLGSVASQIPAPRLRTDIEHRRLSLLRELAQLSLKLNVHSQSALWRSCRRVSRKSGNTDV